MNFGISSSSMLTNIPIRHRKQEMVMDCSIEKLEVKMKCR